VDCAGIQGVGSVLGRGIAGSPDLDFGMWHRCSSYVVVDSVGTLQNLRVACFAGECYCCLCICKHRVTLLRAVKLTSVVLGVKTVRAVCGEWQEDLLCAVPVRTLELIRILSTAVHC
jgi:hypothetical protein